MDASTILGWLETERLGMADLLEQLRPADWEVPSLCPGWTVREVAAHLTLSTRTTFLGTVLGMIRSRGDWDRMTATAASRRAARYGPAELIDQLRSTAASSRRAPGAGPLDPLVDALVHGQDIARPLGLNRTMPPGPATAALDYVRASTFYGADRRFDGVTLIATDTDWSGGEGAAEVQGSVTDLLLVATGRSVGLDGLSGAGVKKIADAW